MAFDSLDLVPRGPHPFDSDAAFLQALWEGALGREAAGWLATLPPIKRQPNLVFAAARWHGAQAPGEYAAFKSVLLAREQAVKQTIRDRAIAGENVDINSLISDEGTAGIGVVGELHRCGLAPELLQQRGGAARQRRERVHQVRGHDVLQRAEHVLDAARVLLLPLAQHRAHWRARADAGQQLVVGLVHRHRLPSRGAWLMRRARAIRVRR